MIIIKRKFRITELIDSSLPSPHVDIELEGEQILVDDLIKEIIEKYGTETRIIKELVV